MPSHASSCRGRLARGAATTPLRLAGLATALMALLSAKPAAADPTAADKETARRLMTEGRAHRRDGDAKAALQSFLAADAIMHVPTTGLEVAKTEVDLGQLVEARDALLAVTRLPDPGNEPRAFTEAREAAKTLGAELVPRIPSLTVKLLGAPTDATVKVTVDGAQIPPVALAAPRAVDPGHHVVVATAGTGDPKQVEVDVKEAETKEVSLDLAAGGPAPTPPPAAHDGSNDTLRLVSYVSFGVGGVGLLTGAITGILAITSLSAAKGQGCMGNQCPPAANSDLDKAGTMATVSTIGFIVGGVGVAGGVTTFLLSRGGKPSEGNPAPASPAVSVYFSPTSVGLRGSF